MRRVACAAVLALSAPALPHRLDEYLQLTALTVTKGRIEAKMILTPGVAVAKRVVTLIDTDRDGILSEREKEAYAARVLRDVSLSVDGKALRLRVVATRFPSIAAMSKGVGEIDLDLAAPTSGRSGDHRLRFENRHQKPLAAYLVECFAPDDPGLRVLGQSRSREQERYELAYRQSAPSGAPGRTFPARTAS